MKLHLLLLTIISYQIRDIKVEINYIQSVLKWYNSHVMVSKAILNLGSSEKWYYDVNWSR